MLIAIVLFLAYLTTAKFGLSLNAVSGFATLIWPPTGISLVALFVYGLKLWPAIFLGAFIANLTTGAPLPIALGIATGNTLEACVGVFLLKKVINFNPSLDSLKDVLGLIFLAGMAATGVSATIGVLSLFLGGIVKTTALISTWTTWWVGDMISNLVIAPFLFIWGRGTTFRLQKRKFIEIMLLTLLLTTSAFLVFYQFLIISPRDHPISYLIFPPLVWAAVRFGQRGATLAILALSIIAITSTVLGFGPFNRGSFTENLLFLQLFMAVSGMTGLILGALTSEKERLEARKDEFISVASHELKTPITTIKGYTQILSYLLKNSRNENVTTYLSKMDEQLVRMTKLVTDLLDVSKIQSGTLELHKEHFKMLDLVKEIIEDMHITTRHEISLDGDNKASLLADRDRIREVLVNLISNAIKYSPKAKRVLIKVAEAGDYIKISVQDFGIGIARKHQDFIFERFFQAENRIRQSFQGLGLGLYIASAIVRKHNGEIKVESVKGKGSTFTIFLPKRGE